MARSSAGRAPPSHGGGQGFESPRVHSDPPSRSGEGRGEGRSAGTTGSEARLGSDPRRLDREDLEALRQEFALGHRGDDLDDDLHQVRRGARLGIALEDWANTRKVPLVYARALRRFIEQG